MERYKRAIDFIGFVRNLHHEVKEYCDKLYDILESEKVKMIVGYLSEHEQKMAETLTEYERGLSKGIEETWFQFIDMPEKPQCLKSVSLDKNMSAGDVLLLISKIDNCLISLYKKLEELAVSEEVKNVFGNLASLEQNEMRKIIHNIQKVDDI
jgi:hypothetical protein